MTEGENTGISKISCQKIFLYPGGRHRNIMKLENYRVCGDIDADRKIKNVHYEGVDGRLYA